MALMPKLVVRVPWHLPWRMRLASIVLWIAALALRCLRIHATVNMEIDGAAIGDELRIEKA